MTYPFDPELRERTTDRLYALLPELYRLRDFSDPNSEPKKSKQTAPGLEELYRFLHVVAAPLAEVRQGIEGFHANLFVDTMADWALPYLAKLVELTLIFPDARANRRDLRSAVAFRRLKGTVNTLDRLVPTSCRSGSSPRRRASSSSSFLRISISSGPRMPSRVSSRR